MKAKKILNAIFNAGQNSLLDKPKQNVIVEHAFDPNKYNRSERRTGSFVIKNETNGLYAKQFTKKDGKTVYKDVELKDASLFAFRSVEFVMNAIWLIEPNVNLNYEMAYKYKGKILTK